MRSACLGLALACLFLLLLPLYRVSPQINFTIQVSNRLLYATLINGTTRYYRLDNTSAWSAARVGEEWAVGFTCMSNSSASFFYSRLLGPAILVGSVQNLGDAHYRVAFNITDAGQYRLELILSFLSSAVRRQRGDARVFVFVANLCLIFVPSAQMTNMQDKQTTLHIPKVSVREI